MYQYKVYYDFLTDGVWTYNSIFEIDLEEKGLHKDAESEAERFIVQEVKCRQDRISKVTCD